MTCEGLPLTERKRGLAAIMPEANRRVLFLDSIAERGLDLFREAVALDVRQSPKAIEFSA